MVEIKVGEYYVIRYLTFEDLIEVLRVEDINVLTSVVASSAKSYLHADKGSRRYISPTFIEKRGTKLEPKETDAWEVLYG